MPISSRQMQGTTTTIDRHTVVIEDLERAADVSDLLQELLQLLHGHLLNLTVLPLVHPVSRKRRKL